MCPVSLLIPWQDTVAHRFQLLPFLSFLLFYAFGHTLADIPRHMYIYACVYLMYF